MNITSSYSYEPHITVVDPYLSYPGLCSFYEDSQEAQEMGTMNHLIRPEHEQVDIFLERFDAFSPKEAKETAYVTIYEEISLLSNKLWEIQCRITTWKSRHNSLSSFFRLPDELMLEVWEYVVHNADAFTPSGARLAAIPGIFGVSQVCAYWRRLALKSPALWTWLCLRRPHSVEHLLDLSRGLDLTLILDTSGSGHSFTHLVKTSDNFLSVLREAFRRSKAVVFQNLHNDIPVMSSLLQLIPSTCLTQFTRVEATGPQDSALNHNQSNVFNRFIQNLPQLRTLILEKHTIFSPQIHIPRLNGASTPRSITNLQISFNARVHPQLASIRSVVETMSHFPGLRHLVLENIFSPLSKEDNSYCMNFPGIKLPALSDLILLGAAATCNRFLATIDVTAPDIFIGLDGLWDEPGFSHNLALRQVFLNCALKIPRVGKLILRDSEVRGDCIIQLHSHDKHSFAHIPMSIKQCLHLLTHLKRTRRLGHVYEITYGISSSHLAVWQSLDRLIFPRLNTIIFNPFIHPSFLRAFSQLRDSSDTVFDPWNVELLQLGITDLRARTKRPLYLMDMNIRFLDTCTIGPKKKYLPSEYREQILRISAARTCYELFLTQLARNNPNKGLHGETGPLEETTKNSGTSVLVVDSVNA